MLISFDIDGTLEVGDPPGGITMDMVRRAQESGCLIGSCSDRTSSGQRAMWDTHNIQVDFVAPKHLLGGVKERFDTDRYIHIGDRDLDRQYALEAGFEFMWEHEALVKPPWLPPSDDNPTNDP
ncbi:MAG: HAD family hydrolase [Nitrospinae bacterium]|nr:HAD family hydrolase [Nitrospinota bacterium]